MRTNTPGMSHVCFRCRHGSRHGAPLQRWRSSQASTLAGRGARWLAENICACTRCRVSATTAHDLHRRTCLENDHSKGQCMAARTNLLEGRMDFGVLDSQLETWASPIRRCRRGGVACSGMVGFVRSEDELHNWAQPVRGAHVMLDCCSALTSWRSLAVRKGAVGAAGAKLSKHVCRLPRRCVVDRC